MLSRNFLSQRHRLHCAVGTKVNREPNKSVHIRKLRVRVTWTSGKRSQTKRYQRWGRLIEVTCPWVKTDRLLCRAYRKEIIEISPLFILLNLKHVRKIKTQEHKHKDSK